MDKTKMKIMFMILIVGIKESDSYGAYPYSRQETMPMQKRLHLSSYEDVKSEVQPNADERMSKIMKSPVFGLSLPPVAGALQVQSNQLSLVEEVEEIPDSKNQLVLEDDGTPSSGAGVLNPWLYRFPPWSDPRNPIPPGLQEEAVGSSRLEQMTKKPSVKRKQMVTIPGDSNYRAEVVKTILDLILSENDVPNKAEIREPQKKRLNAIDTMLEFASANPNKPTPPSIKKDQLKDVGFKDIVGGFAQASHFEVFNEEDSVVLVISDENSGELSSSKKSSNSKTNKNFGKVINMPDGNDDLPKSQVTSKKNRLKSSIPIDIKQILTSRPKVNVPRFQPLPLEGENNLEEPQFGRLESNVESAELIVDKPKQTKKSLFWVPLIPGIPLPILIQHFANTRKLNLLSQQGENQISSDRSDSDNTYRIRLRNREKSTTITPMPKSIQDIIRSNTDTSEPLYRRERQSVYNRQKDSKKNSTRWVWSG